MKKYTGLLCALLIVLVLAACSDGDANNKYSRDLDEEDFAEYLVSHIVFTDMMSEVDDDAAEALYALYGLTEEDYDDLTAYMSTGATAEEIVVISVDNDEQAVKVSDILKARVDAQIKSFENYVPGEVNKLSEAVIEQVDNCIILAVCDDYDEYLTAKTDFLTNIAAID